MDMINLPPSPCVFTTNWLHRLWDPSDWPSGDSDLAGLNSGEVSLIHRWSKDESPEQTGLLAGVGTILHDEQRPLVTAASLINWLYRWPLTELLAVRLEIVQRVESLNDELSDHVLGLHLQSFSQVLAYGVRSEVHRHEYKEQEGFIFPSERLRNNWALALAFEGSAVFSQRWLSQYHLNDMHPLLMRAYATIAAVAHVESGLVNEGLLPQDPALREWVTQGYQYVPLYRLMGEVMHALYQGVRSDQVRYQVMSQPIGELTQQNLSQFIAGFDASETEQRAYLNSEYADETALTTGSLAGYSPVRIALSLGRIEQAERLIDRRNNLQMFDKALPWLVSFFHGRIAWQQGHKDQAKEHFRTAYHAASAQGALGRLDFEMYCASDISPLNWLAMMPSCG